MIKMNITTEELNIRKKRMESINNFDKTDRPALMCYVDIFQYLRQMGIECEDYMKDPKLHIETQLGFQKNILEQFATDQYSVNPGIDLFVARIAHAYGSTIKYISGSLPWTDHWVKDEKDLLLLDKMNVTNNGLFLKEKEFRKYALENIWKYPVELADGNSIYPLESMKMPRFDCDGIFSIAQMIMGMEDLFIACYDRPEFVHKLLEIITDKYVEHWQDVVKTFGVQSVSEIVLADDTASYLAPDMFEEFCIPYMKKIRNTFPQAKALLHFCKTVPEYVDMFSKTMKIDGYTGFKPNAGIKSIKDSFKPVHDLLGNKMLLYPDTDPCIVETCTLEEVYQEVLEILETFEGSNGVLISFSTWSAEKSKIGMKACEDYAKRKGV